MQANSKGRKTVQRPDVILEQGDLYLQEALTEVGLPKYVEDLMKNMRELLENLSNELAIVELCIKKRYSWKRYQMLVKKQHAKQRVNIARPSEVTQKSSIQYQALDRLDVVLEQGDFHLQEALIQAGFPQYIERFANSIHNVFKNLSNQVVLAELCLKDRYGWDQYNTLAQSQREKRRKYQT